MADSDRITTPRSVKRGKQKEVLPEASPSPASRFRVASGGFGSGLDKVPAPVITNQKYQSKHELVKPVPAEVGSVTLPPISEQMARQSFSDARASMSNGPQEPGNQMDETSVDPFDTNPYKDKADEIGVSHGFGPGVLGNLLIPPGWNEGDPPIDPHLARQIFNQSRATAAADLVRDVQETNGVHNLEQSALNEERDEVWARDYKMDKYILKQRVEIYETYIKRQREQAEREREKTYTDSARQVQTDILRIPFGLPSSGKPQVLDPVLAIQSIQSAFTQYSANKLKISLWDVANERQLKSAIDKCQSSLVRSPSFRPGQSQPQTPVNGSFGDMSLEIPNPAGYRPQVPQTDDLANGYVARYPGNSRSAMSQLPQFPLPQGHDTGRGLQGNQRSSFGQVAQFPQPVQNRNRNQTPLHSRGSSMERFDGRGPAQQQDGRHRFGQEHINGGGAGPEQYSRHVPVLNSRGQSPDLQIVAEYPALGTHNAMSGYNVARNPTAGNTVVGPSRKGPKSKKARNTTPLSRKLNMTKPQASTPETWYQAYVEAANLPKSEISVDFINQTLAESGDPTRVGAPATPKKGATPKRRPNKSPVDMTKSFKISTQTANALMRAGAKLVAQPGQLPGTAVNTAVAPSSSAKASTAATTAVNTQPSVPTTASSTTRPGTPSDASDASDEDPDDETFTPEGKRKVSGPSSVKKRTKTTAKES